MSQLETPIAFIIFNRPDTTQRVFDEIKKVHPKKLFVISDGARNKEEEKLVEETRKIIDQVDWNCEVQKNYADKNLGCKVRVSSGINWFFKNVEQGIILEDDCLPSPSFFTFCEDLLEKYKSDREVMMVGGSNFQGGIKRGAGSYYFSHCCHIWGWATWRRAWESYDLEMRDYPEFKKNDSINKIWNDRHVGKFWINIFDKVYKNKIDTWDYQWLYAIWNNGGVSIIPNHNLISNIGFDDRATHTKNEDVRVSNIKTQEMTFPLEHPGSITTNEEADEFTNQNIFGIKKGTK